MNQGRSIRRGQVAPAIARVVAVLAVALPVSLLATVPLQVEAAGAATTSTTKPPTPTTTTKPPTTTTKPPANAIATLKVTAGEVSVQAKGATSFMAATDGQSLQAGDTVKTGPTGRAEVEYAKDTFTRLDVNTTFTVVRLTDEQGNRRVQGSLDTGRTWNRTATLTQSESFEQKGAGATAAVLGTAFMIECDTVTHCRFVAVDHLIQMTDSAGTQILDPLQAIDVTAGVPSEVTTLTVDEIAAIAWIQQNLLLDKFLGIGDGPFVTFTGTLVVENGVVQSFTENPPPPPPPAPTAPGAPTHVSATPAGSGTASVSFTPPADNGGSPITLYTVVATADGQVPVTATGPGSPITVTGLTNGATYDFTVTASNAVGTGSGSTPVELPIPPTAPGAPSITSAEATGPTAVNVTVAPPANSGGSPITGYSVVATAPGEGARFGTGAGPVVTVGSLVDGVAWTFSVTATNAAGTGPSSSSVDATTPEIPRFAASPIDPFGEQTEAPDIDIPLNCFNFFSITICNVFDGAYTFTFNYENPAAVPDYVTFSDLPASSVGALYTVDGEIDPEDGPPACWFSSDCTPVATDAQYDPYQMFQFDPSLRCAVSLLCQLPKDDTFTAVAHSDEFTDTDSVTVDVTVRDARVDEDDGEGDDEGSA